MLATPNLSINKKMDITTFTDLDSWMQVFILNSQNLDTSVKLQLREVSNIINNELTFTDVDKKKCETEQFTGWYTTNKDFEVIADDSEEGCELYDFYDRKYVSAGLFLKRVFKANV